MKRTHQGFRSTGTAHVPTPPGLKGEERKRFKAKTAYLICCHFAEDDGESLVDPVELYLAGKNAVYATRDAAIAFMQDLDE